MWCLSTCFIKRSHVKPEIKSWRKIADNVSNLNQHHQWMLNYFCDPNRWVHIFVACWFTVELANQALQLCKALTSLSYEHDYSDCKIIWVTSFNCISVSKELLIIIFSYNHGTPPEACRCVQSKKHHTSPEMMIYRALETRSKFNKEEKLLNYTLIQIGRIFLRLWWIV